MAKRAESEKESQKEEGRPFTPGRKRTHAKVEDIESLQKALLETQKNMAEFIKSQDERMKMLEANQGTIVKALTEKSANPEGGGGFWDEAAKGIVGSIMHPPSPLEKLAQRSLVEDLLLGRTIRRGVILSMGKNMYKKFTKDFDEVMKELGEESEATESE